MQNNKKHGFTLVELLVVIAIIAILATVSVVGYLGFTEKANLSNDQQMIKMANDALLYKSVEKAPTTAGEAVSDLYTQGFSDEKLEPFSNNHHYAYSLEKNKLFLLDGNDEVVFPEEDIEVSSLWGFFRNRDIDKIQSVTKYVAMGSITQAQAFESVFSGNDTEYKLDLNNNIITVNGKNNITVSNGHILPDSTFKTEGQNVSRKVKANSTSNFENKSVGDEVDTKVLIKDVFILYDKDTLDNFKAKVSALGAGKEEVIIEDCVFEGPEAGGSSYLADLEINMPYKLTYRNCTWMNFSGTFAVKVCGAHNQFEFDKCKLINCERGINIDPGELGVVEETQPKAGSSIHHCEFILSNTLKSKAIQFTDIYASEDKYDIDTIVADEPLWNIYNNNFKSGTAVINLHENFVRINNKFAAYNPIVLTQSQFEKAYKFSNNKIGKGVAKGSKDVLGSGDVQFNDDENILLDGIIQYIDKNL